MIRLRTFGTVALERDETPLTGRNTQRRRLALLVLLASARRRPVSRDRVLGLLWPEREMDRARHALAQLIYELRRDLGQSVIIGSADDLLLDTASITSDIDDFEDAFHRRAMERVVEVYAGPFLDGFFVSDAAEFERWVEERRHELATKYLHALETLSVLATDRGQFATAAEYLRQAAALDPLSARHALALMNALARAGDRAAAIRHAQLYSRLVRCELETEADPSVTRLASELASAVHESGAMPGSPEPSSEPGPSSPSISTEPAQCEPALQPSAAPTRVGDSPPVSRRSWMPNRSALPLIAASVLLAIGAAAMLGAPRGRPAAAPRLVVLGDVASSDSVLSLAAREVIRAELERRPDVAVLGDAATAGTLRLMKMDASARLTEAVADDVALRNGAPLVIVGRITTLGTGIEIVTRLLDPRRASAVAVVSARPAGNGEVVQALARIGTELRERAGHSRVDNPQPLPAVTTSSLEALRAYALARAALARVDRPAAIAYAEAAVAQDSDFALAHYLLGDLLWYVDQEHRAEVHLARAYRLSARLPVRQRLLVRARYAQLVLDRPDSALAYWRALRAAYPGEPLGYEGAVWADLAVGAYEDAAAAADSALRLDSTAAPQVRNRMIALLALRDTAGALALTRGAGARWPYLEQQTLMAEYLMRADLPGLRRLIDSIAPPMLGGRPNTDLAPTRQALLLSLGRVREAANYAVVVAATLHAQFAIRAELFQAHAELALGGGSPERGRELLRAAVARLDSTDLSPPATARLAELAASAAAAAGDRGSLASLRRIVMQRDAGRSLPSHRLALLTIDGAAAMVRGDYASAIRLLDRTRARGFYGRSESALVLVEAAAWRQAGQHSRADSLYRLVSTPGHLHDDGDVWLSLRPIALASIGGSPSLPGRLALGNPAKSP